MILSSILCFSFYAALLSTLSALIVFLLRQRGSYFKSVKRLFIEALLSIAVLISCDIVKNHVVRSEAVIWFTTRIGVSAALSAAMLVRIAASTLLERPMRSVSLWKSYVNWFFPKKPSLPRVLYVGIMAFVFIVTWVLGPWRPKLIRDIWGMTVYIPEYEWWYLACLCAVLAAFIAYPGSMFILSGRRYRERRVAWASRSMGICWVGVGLSLITFHGILRSLELEVIEVGYSIDIVMFGVMAYFFAKTTVLESFFETAYPSVQIGEGESVVALYPAIADKMSVFAAFIRDGLLDGDRVVYAFPDSEARSVKGCLWKRGVDIERAVKSGSLVLSSLSERYGGEEYDSETRGRHLLKEVEDAKGLGYKHLRVLVDYGDVHRVFKDPRRFLDELGKLLRQFGQPYLITLRTFNLETLGEEEVEQLRAYGAGKLFMGRGFSIETIDAFSRQLGLRHKELIGKKILLEFDPASNYELAVRSFLLEGLINWESVVVFAPRGSAVYSRFVKRRMRFFHLTEQVSAPTAGPSEREILLPENNTSLLLEALDRAVKAPHGNVSILFDSLSDLVLTVGLERAYRFTRYALELLTSERVTALFLLNPKAHDPKVVTNLRGLFGSQITYGERGLQITKLA